MTVILKNIFRFPIKGFSGEELKEIKLTKGAAIYGDRKFAFARHETVINEFSLEFMKKTNFLALVKDEKLAQLKLDLNLEQNFLKLYFKNKLTFSGSIAEENDLNRLSEFICHFLKIDIMKKPKLVKDKSIKKEMFKHSFSDIPDKAISLISLNTIRDIEKKIGKKINFLRFRGNIIFEGLKSWEEFDLIGKNLRIGTAELKVFKKTQRCRATTVNPENGNRDINIPFELNKYYGHFDFGVYSKVIKGGIISVNDNIKIL